jgi:hypothetical protein
MYSICSVSITFSNPCTCKIVNSRCPQGTRLLTTEYIEFWHKIVNIHDLLVILTVVNMSTLVRVSSNCPPVREGALQEQTCNCLTVTKNLVLCPRCCMKPRQTGRLTSGRNINLTSALSELVRELLWFSHCKLLLLEAGSWGWEQFGNPVEGYRPPLKATTKQRQWRLDSGH